MRAAPYDLSAFGVTPIHLENAAGRREYAVLQREIAEKAQPIRAALIEAYRQLLSRVSSS
jgi:hypothetical protein